MELQDTTITTEFFVLAENYPAKVVKVVDGDTVNAVIDLPGFGFRQFKVRLYGIDTPELRPPRSDPDRDEIIQKAQEARDVLKEKICDKVVFLKCYGWGKYGRLLAEIYFEDENINEWLVENGFAEIYS